MGSLAAGGAAAVGTGAFTSVSAERSVNVQVASDANAFLQLSSISWSNNSQDYTTTSQGTLDIFHPSDDVDGDGFNKNAVTYVDNLFRIGNQSSQTQYVWLAEVGNPDYISNSFESPAGPHFVAFYTPGNRDGENWQGISYGSAPEDDANQNTRGPDQPNSKAPADAAPFNGDGMSDDPPGARADAVEIAPGNYVNVGMVVDTTISNWTTGEPDRKPVLGDLLDSVIVKARADEADTPVTL